MTEKRDSRDKLLVLGMSFVFFVGGVLSLQMERGPVRTALVALCTAALLAVALRQTVRRLRKR